MNRSEVRLSVIVPAFNEEKNVPRMVEEITAAVDRLKITYEIIFIDDGSKDGTFAALKEARKNHPRIKVIRFRKNFGQTAALSAGFDYARGEIILTIDADLENDPDDIGLLLDKIEEGYDLVSGWRKDRWKKHFFFPAACPRSWPIGSSPISPKSVSAITAAR